MRAISREGETNLRINSPRQIREHFHYHINCVQGPQCVKNKYISIDINTVQHTFINMNTAYRGFTMLTGGDGRKRKWPLKNKSHDRKRKWPLKTVT